jgi:hypothetical protein
MAEFQSLPNRKISLSRQKYGELREEEIDSSQHKSPSKSPLKQSPLLLRLPIERINPFFSVFAQALSNNVVPERPKTPEIKTDSPCLYPAQ